MTASSRPVVPPAPPALRLGDYVSVTYRTSAGPAHWVGSVVEVLETFGLARISDGRRTHTAAIRGAVYIRLLMPAAERLDLVDGVPTSLAAPAAGPVPDHVLAIA